MDSKGKRQGGTVKRHQHEPQTCQKRTKSSGEGTPQAAAGDQLARHGADMPQPTDECPMHDVIEEKLNKAHKDLIRWDAEFTEFAFNEPVTEELAPNYFDVVLHPIDLATMSNKLTNGSYKHVQEGGLSVYDHHSWDTFWSDVDLIVANCKVYNPEPHEFFTFAEELQAYARKHKTVLWQQEQGRGQQAQARALAGQQQGQQQGEVAGQQQGGGQQAQARALAGQQQGRVAGHEQGGVASQEQGGGQQAQACALAGQQQGGVASQEKGGGQQPQAPVLAGQQRVQVPKDSHMNCVKHMRAKQVQACLGGPIPGTNLQWCYDYDGLGELIIYEQDPNNPKLGIMATGSMVINNHGDFRLATMQLMNRFLTFISIYLTLDAGRWIAHIEGQADVPYPRTTHHTTDIGQGLLAAGYFVEGSGKLIMPGRLTK
eukprot:jgi/Chrzof1/9746/Cz04g14100.t1